MLNRSKPKFYCIERRMMNQYNNNNNPFTSNVTQPTLFYFGNQKSGHFHHCSNSLPPFLALRTEAPRQTLQAHWMLKTLSRGRLKQIDCAPHSNTEIHEPFTFHFWRLRKSKIRTVGRYAKTQVKLTMRHRLHTGTAIGFTEGLL